jgi:type IV secretion system protein VirB4
VISASTDNIEILRQVLASKAEEKGVAEGDLLPDDWLENFYASRKGSGKRPAQPSGSGRSAAGA